MVAILSRSQYVNMISRCCKAEFRALLSDLNILSIKPSNVRGFVGFVTNGIHKHLKQFIIILSSPLAYVPTEHMT